MNLRDLHYLVAVADLIHFGKAAKACHTSQPTLSMQLKKLEQTLGVILFERNNKRISITPVGQEIVERARKILREAKEIQTIAKALQDPYAGDFRLGAFPTLAPYFFPTAMPLMREELSKLKFILVEEKTDLLLDKLRDGLLDAAFLALPIQDSALETAVLFNDPFLLAVSQIHPLAKTTRIHPHDIQTEPLLLLEEGHCLRDQALAVCHTTGGKEQQEFRASSLETLRHMVAAGTGITLIPQIAQQATDGIVYIPFAASPPSRTIGLVWRKTSARKKCIEKLIAILSEEICDKGISPKSPFPVGEG